MADNTETNPGSGGDIIASDDIGGVKFQRVKLIHGADGVNDGDVATANPLPVAQTGAIPAGLNNIGDVDVASLPVTGYSATASFTPAASSHVAGDVNGAAQEFTSMGPSGRVIRIDSASLMIAGASAEATAWRLHLYTVTPPSAISDSGVWDLPSGDRASYRGYIDLPSTAADLGSSQYVEVNNVGKMVDLSGTSLFGYLQNLTTLTPAAVAHTVRLTAVAF